MKYLLLIAGLYLSFSLHAQDKKGHIMADFRFTPDSIQLRWSPDNARFWVLGNKYGYVIEKLAVDKANPWSLKGIKKITPQPLKPASVPQWEKLFNKIEKAGVVAQAIYGETFDIAHKKEGSPLGRALQANDEREQRFGFSALVADQYYEVAKAAALGFTDKNINKNQVYLYRIYCPIPAKEKYQSDTAYVEADFSQQTTVTAPRGVEGDFGDRTVQLRWDSDNIPNYFSGYFIERSENGKNYTMLNKEPEVYFKGDDDAGKAFNDKVIKNDSLPANEVTYYYRIRGLTPFGELSPPSAVIKGMGHDVLKDTPVITLAGVQKDGNVQINWSFPEKKNSRIRHFQVRRSTTIDKGIVSVDSILSIAEANTRQFIDKKPLPTAYYQVVAVGNYNEELVSYITAMELPDSIPPAPPIGLQGKIDTMGVVHLTWLPNKEPDFLGYRVFRANLNGGNFEQVTDSTHLATSFTDTVNVQTLTRYVYYTLVAIDKRSNPSDFSDTIRLQRPDKYPPVAPVFTDFKVKPQRVELKWSNSPSMDLDSTLLYRRRLGSLPWTKLAGFYKNSAESFIDSTGASAQRYEYRLLAKDESGKLSPDDKKYLAVQWLEVNSRPAPVIQVEKQKNLVLLTWKPLPGLKKMLIYRKTDKIPLTLYRTIWGPAETSCKDTFVTGGNVYSYLVKAVFEDNTESFFSKEVTLYYE